MHSFNKIIISWFNILWSLELNLSVLQTKEPVDHWLSQLSNIIENLGILQSSIL